MSEDRAESVETIEQEPLEFKDYVTPSGRMAGPAIGLLIPIGIVLTVGLSFLEMKAKIPAVWIVVVVMIVAAILAEAIVGFMAFCLIKTIKRVVSLWRNLGVR